ncbi:MAG: hypothetical protein J6Y62_01435 [Clostridia bacterium]|nr:hypothetical protein [Clostridia bacterium]
MIDKEIIIGVDRGGTPVPRSEISQMAGRCGRSYEKSGEVVCIVPPGRAGYAEDCLNGGPLPVFSCFDDPMTMLFDLLPAMMERGGMDLDALRKWRSRSFSFFQKGDLPDWPCYVKEWLSTGCVEESGGVIRATALGALAARNYMPPDAAALMRAKLAEYPGGYDLKLCPWLLSFNERAKDSEDHPEYDEFMSGVSSLGVFFERDESMEAFAIYRAMLPGRPKWIRHQAAEVKKDLDRRFNVLEGLCGIDGVDLEEAIRMWRLQAERKVPEELYPLLHDFPDATLPVLAELDSLGIRGRGHGKEELEHASKNLLKYLHGLASGKTEGMVRGRGEPASGAAEERRQDEA